MTSVSRATLQTAMEVFSTNQTIPCIPDVRRRLSSTAEATARATMDPRLGRLVQPIRRVIQRLQRTIARIRTPRKTLSGEICCPRGGISETEKRLMNSDSPSRSTKSAAALKKAKIRNSTECTGLRAEITISADAMMTDENT